MKSLCIALLLLSCNIEASELRLSALADVMHAPGSAIVHGRYGDRVGVSLGLWARDAGSLAETVTSCHDYAVYPMRRHCEPTALKTGEDRSADMLLGADYRWRDNRWHYGAGIVWIDDKNALNGTRFNFDLSLGYDLSPRFGVLFHHISHFRAAGIREGRANDGWNMLGLTLRLK